MYDTESLSIPALIRMVSMLTYSTLHDFDAHLCPLFMHPVYIYVPLFPYPILTPPSEPACPPAFDVTGRNVTLNGKLVPNLLISNYAAVSPPGEREGKYSLRHYSHHDGP